MLRVVKSFKTTSRSHKKKMGGTDATRKDHVLRTVRGSLIGTEVLDTRDYRSVYTLYARIRYALPPTGDRRWRKPVPLPADWMFSDGNDRPRDYRKFGSICPQLVGDYNAINLSQWQEIVENTMDEDCLFLNIWVPAGCKPALGGWPIQFMIRKCGP